MKMLLFVPLDPQRTTKVEFPFTQSPGGVYKVLFEAGHTTGSAYGCTTHVGVALLEDSSVQVESGGGTFGLTVDSGMMKLDVEKLLLEIPLLIPAGLPGELFASLGELAKSLENAVGGCSMIITPGFEPLGEIVVTVLLLPLKLEVPVYVT